MESALRKTAEVAAKATPKPADRAPSKLADRRPPEPADRATPEPAEMATPKPAVGSSDEITSNPTAHMAATPAVASSAPSAPRRRNVRRRSGQGSSNSKDCDLVQHRSLRLTPRRRTVRWRSRSTRRAGSPRIGDSKAPMQTDVPVGCVRGALTQPSQPP
jgi:hypothetical protein